MEDARLAALRRCAGLPNSATLEAMIANSRIQGGRLATAQGALNKVPEITAVFWVIKVLTTGMGEALSDFLLNGGTGVPGLGLVGTLVLDAAIFVTALVLQFSVRRYMAWVYWFAVVAVSVFGTVASDVVAYVVGVPLWAVSTLYAGILAMIFVVWYMSEKTLSIHAINTWRREAFYWATVFFTFAMGTALGDLTAVPLKLGFLASGIMFGALIAVPWIAHRRFGLNAIAAFWSAYVVTRPLGASFADWFGASHERTGLGLGFGWVALVMTVLIVVFVGYSAMNQNAAPKLGS
ncbi:MAG TPA: hypothetical protein VH008_01280 [Pseudonocardia sp.]|nr:hypothetical protein [Pseudonocardia sp.]